MNRVRTGAVLATLIVGALAFVPAAGATTINVGKGIDGATFGSKPAAVKKALGTPDRVIQQGPSGTYLVWMYKKPSGTISLSFTLNAHRLFFIAINGQPLRTSKNVGVGSLLPAAQAAYPGGTLIQGSPGPNPEAVAYRVDGTYRGKPTSTLFDFWSTQTPMTSVVMSWNMPK